MSDLLTRIREDMKSAMRAADKPRLGAIRLILAALKQEEVDTQSELDDVRVVGILDKMSKQRRESLAQYRDVGREDLAAREQLELDVIATYLPEPLTEEALRALVDETIAAVGAASMKDMGAVMGRLRSQVQGKADTGLVSRLVKARLAG